MLQLLYCNLYYRPTTHPDGEGIGCQYTKTQFEVPPGTIFLDEAGCVPEAQRLQREEKDYLLEKGRTLQQAPNTTTPSGLLRPLTTAQLCLTTYRIPVRDVLFVMLCPPDDNLQKALQTSQHALLLATICLLEDSGLVNPAVLANPKDPGQPRQRQLVTGLVEQLLRFCSQSPAVSLNADFVRHELRWLCYQQTSQQPHR